ncbi:hypothetical protein QFZ64_006902 [Streptomyces sp. B3I8]|nr:hypothetical protein [Streptomyces sp. B3I8]
MTASGAALRGQTHPPEDEPGARRVPGARRAGGGRRGGEAADGKGPCRKAASFCLPARRTPPRQDEYGGGEDPVRDAQRGLPYTHDEHARREVAEQGEQHAQPAGEEQRRSPRSLSISGTAACGLSRGRASDITSPSASCPATRSAATSRSRASTVRRSRARTRGAVRNPGRPYRAATHPNHEEGRTQPWQRRHTRLAELRQEEDHEGEDAQALPPRAVPAGVHGAVDQQQERHPRREAGRRSASLDPAARHRYASHDCIPAHRGYREPGVHRGEAGPQRALPPRPTGIPSPARTLRVMEVAGAMPGSQAGPGGTLRRSGRSPHV